MPKTLTILVADLVDSRRVPDRGAFAKTLRVALDDAADAFAHEWHAPLGVTKGIDELSGVLVRPARAYAIASAVNLAVWPQRFRWGLATGEIDVAARGRNPGVMDGPGFHRAADALARAKSFDLPFHVEIPGVAPTASALVDQLARMCGLWMETWSPGQAAAARAMILARTQQEAAKALGISQQAVSQAVQAAHRPELAAAEAAIGAWLSEIPMRPPQQENPE